MDQISKAALSIECVFEEQSFRFEILKTEFEAINPQRLSFEAILEAIPVVGGIANIAQVCSNCILIVADNAQAYLLLSLRSGDTLRRMSPLVCFVSFILAN